MFPKTKYFLDETLKTIYHAFQFTFYKFVTFVIFYLRNYILETLTKNNMKTKYVINMIQLRKSPFCLKNLILLIIPTNTDCTKQYIIDIVRLNIKDEIGTKLFY